MVNKFIQWILISTQCLLISCAITPSVTNQYTLASFSHKSLDSQPPRYSLLITPPEALAGYDSVQMLYVNKPFEISSFVHNAWIAPPADMLLPLLLQSLQRTGYFYVVATSPYSEKTDYRLDTQLLELQQNFLKKPSEITLKVKFVLTRTSDNGVIGSQLIDLQVPCPMDTPYGGVLAANKATQSLTAEVSTFIQKQLNQPKRIKTKG